MTQSMTHPQATYLYLADLYRLTSFYWLRRLLSLRPVLPRGYPDWQIHRCSPLWFLFVEAKCDQNKPLTVAQTYFVFSHDPWILLTPGKTCAFICIWKAVSVSLLSPPNPPPPNTHPHTTSRVGRGIQVRKIWLPVSALPCLI